MQQILDGDSLIALYSFLFLAPFTLAYFITRLARVFR